MIQKSSDRNTLTNSELWVKTENMVRKVLVDAKIPFVEVEDEAAFYGPKIDVQIWSTIGREFTLATNQVDFSQPRSFNLSFINKNNESETPLIIHRAPLGTHERFIGFLIEHYAGNFPVWLAPKQAMILPISDRHVEFSEKIKNELRKNEVRVQIDDSNEKVGKKIRNAEMKKIPFMLVVGDKEMENQKVSVRKHGGTDLGSMTVREFADMISKEVRQVFEA